MMFQINMIWTKVSHQHIICFFMGHGDTNYKKNTCHEKKKKNLFFLPAKNGISTTTIIF